MPSRYPLAPSLLAPSPLAPSPLAPSPLAPSPLAPSPLAPVLLSCCLGLILLVSPSGFAAEQVLHGQKFTLPDGFEIQLIAGPPLIDRPICCDFDEQGRLYVAESSGSNDNVQQQLVERPHQIVRLEDTDGDGRFDQRTVFADHMMLPEGALWLDGSLYVAAPPSIWKLTDTNGDGTADQREEWFQGKTLTGCANDLHGPYRGPDGWIYWCKGAFAEQTYDRPGRKPMVTRASHMFRRHPQGGPIESVMTGGMDNPVEVVFTPGGERFFTTTFLQHPGGGRRDGVIHAIYGGVYGKRHGVLDGHPRTGELMPVLAHLGAAAPCGLARLESSQLGEEYRDNIFACLFNMHKVTRHELQAEGASFSTRDSDFLVSDSLDFHPTDVTEDADGSLIVIDTGGWYKLCCPTSQLWKPDVLGAIYRVRRTDAGSVPDAWGKKTAWDSQSLPQLARLLADSRSKVRMRAGDLLAARGSAAVADLQDLYDRSNDPRVRTDVVWTLTRIDDPAARVVVRQALSDTDEIVRHAALHSVSVHRDAAALPGLFELLTGPSVANRRAAAEAIGRIGDLSAVEQLLKAAGDDHDRGLEHSLTYALIELDDARGTRRGLDSDNPFTRRAALIALDQSESGTLSPQDVVPDLKASHPALRDAAAWIVEQHPDWAPQLVDHFRGQLASAKLDDAQQEQLRRQLAGFAGQTVIQQLLAQVLASAETPLNGKLLVLQAMSEAGLKTLPAEWQSPFVLLLTGDDPRLVGQVVATIQSFETTGSPDASLNAALRRVGGDLDFAIEVRLAALAGIAGREAELDEASLALVLSQLPSTNPVGNRSLASDVVSRAKFSSAQLEKLANAIVDVGPLELERVLAAFAQSPTTALGNTVIERLRLCAAASSLPSEKLLAAFRAFPAAVQLEVKKLESDLAESLSEQRRKLEDTLASLPAGEVRRGQQVFHSGQASCYACHAMGYLGGNIGPDLTRIGRIRTERDLLEAVLYPSASFVRSYEPVQIVTTDGQVLSGLLREDNGLEIVITTSERKQLRIRRDEIEELQPGKVSVMPGGLDKQLTPQQLADLLAFLKASQ